MPPPPHLRLTRGSTFKQTKQTEDPLSCASDHSDVSRWAFIRERSSSLGYSALLSDVRHVCCQRDEHPLCLRPTLQLEADESRPTALWMANTPIWPPGRHLAFEYWLLGFSGQVHCDRLYAIPPNCCRRHFTATCSPGSLVRPPHPSSSSTSPQAPCSRVLASWSSAPPCSAAAQAQPSRPGPIQRACS